MLNAARWHLNNLRWSAALLKNNALKKPFIRSLRYQWDCKWKVYPSIHHACTHPSTSEPFTSQAVSALSQHALCKKWCKSSRGCQWFLRLIVLTEINKFRQPSYLGWDSSRNICRRLKKPFKGKSIWTREYLTCWILKIHYLDSIRGKCGSKMVKFSCRGSERKRCGLIEKGVG